MTKLPDQAHEDPERPLESLRSLPPITPPAGLVAKVMQEIERPMPFNLWNWLWRPRAFELRLSPIAALVTAAATVAVVWTVAGGPRPLAPTVADLPRSAPGDATAADVVWVRFVLETRGAQKVAIAGDFNGWDPEATPLSPQVGDVFAVTVPLRKGESYSYMFWVDGEWVADPGAERRPDGFGQQNSLLRL